jgi:hypothetical protein
MSFVPSVTSTRFRRPRIAATLAGFVLAMFSTQAGPRAEGPGSGDTLVSTVREATARFRTVEDAMAAGWQPLTGCVSGPQEGAMGIHYINPALLTDAELDPRKPEALIFEHKNGRATLVGVEFIVLADKWKAEHNGPPVLMGQHMHFAGAPNRYGLDAFYELHVWAWRENPLGTFSDWHRHVSCDDVSGQE